MLTIGTHKERQCLVSRYEKKEKERRERVRKREKLFVSINECLLMKKKLEVRC